VSTEVVEGRASPKGNSRQAAVVSDTEPSCAQASLRSRETEYNYSKSS
jgi:hypothetical protein